MEIEIFKSLVSNKIKALGWHTPVLDFKLKEFVRVGVNFEKISWLKSYDDYSYGEIESAKTRQDISNILTLVNANLIRLHDRIATIRDAEEMKERIQRLLFGECDAKTFGNNLSIGDTRTKKDT